MVHQSQYNKYSSSNVYMVVPQLLLYIFLVNKFSVDHFQAQKSLKKSQQYTAGLLKHYNLNSAKF